MRKPVELDEASSALARRALLVTLGVGTLSSASGLLASTIGMVTPQEFIFVACVFLFTLGALFTLIVFRTVSTQTVATATTGYYATHMCIGVWISLSATEQHLNLFIYLLWFFPLLVFNKLVNQPAISRLLGRTLLIAPIFTILCLSPRWVVVLHPEQRVLLLIYCLTYLCYALTLNLVTRYREKYIVEQQRAESLKVTADVFESISECFLSLDAEYRLIYLNDAACAELDIERELSLHVPLPHAAPSFFSDSIRIGLQAAFMSKVPTSFESNRQSDGRWFDVRCFPRRDGMSIYFRDITSRKSDEARIEHLAFFDVLTGLPNRHNMSNRLTQALATATPRKSIGALLYIDLDDFKTMNDTMGHEAGDALLKQVALRLTSCLGPDSAIARIGGDEFTVILETLDEDPQVATVAATLIANKVLQLFFSPFVIDGFESEIKASIGVTLFGSSETLSSEAQSTETIEDLLKRGDLALYQVKAHGGNNLCFFEPDMQTRVDTRADLRADLRHALMQNQFTLHYQPQVDSRGVVSGSEALLRWLHPVRGFVPPGEFIPLAEEAGLIGDLGRWVLRNACLQLTSWADTPEMKHLTLAVNVSVRQFFDMNFVDDVKEALHSSGADPARLKLEITESSIMEKVAEVIVKMTEFKKLGVSFSLDDFGTGYASLSYLRDLPFDQLKIDRSFIANVLNDDKCASIVRTIIGLGEGLNLSVIAEGVENEAQRNFLMAEGCYFYQGFLYSPAISPSKLEVFLATSNNIRGAQDQMTNTIGKTACRDGVEQPFPFTMAFQPIVDVEAGVVFAYEALVRGMNGESAPSVLTKVTPENRYAFDQNCRVVAITLASRLGLVATGARLSVNFMPGAVYSPAACIQLTLKTAKLVGFPLDRLIFEITEGEEVLDRQHLRSIIEEYQRQGFAVAVDDFGAGYSGMNLLADVPANIIKLDMDLTRNLQERPAAIAVVQAMVGLAKHLGSRLIAEGVETREEYRALRECGVELMQGYLLAKPMFEGLPAFTLPAVRKNDFEKELDAESVAAAAVPGRLVLVKKTA